MHDTPDPLPDGPDYSRSFADVLLFAFSVLAGLAAVLYSDPKGWDVIAVFLGGVAAGWVCEVFLYVIAYHLAYRRYDRERLAWLRKPSPGSSDDG